MAVHLKLSRQSAHLSFLVKCKSSDFLSLLTVLHCDRVLDGVLRYVQGVDMRRPVIITVVDLPQGEIVVPRTWYTSRYWQHFYCFQHFKLHFLQGRVHHSIYGGTRSIKAISDNSNTMIHNKRFEAIPNTTIHNKRYEIYMLYMIVKKKTYLIKFLDQNIFLFSFCLICNNVREITPYIVTCNSCSKHLCFYFWT